MTGAADRLRAFAERSVPEPPGATYRFMIEQEGEFRLGPDKPWVPFTAEQWSSVHKVQFCWHARMKMAPLVTVVVEDAFEAGQGRLTAKVWGVLPVAHGSGPSFDRGEAQRYLAELPWNPMAILRNRELRFGEGEGGATCVWFGEPQTYVDLRLDAGGDVVSAYSTTREREEGEAVPWEGFFADYVDFDGVRMPRRAEVSWVLPDGRFTYFRATVKGCRWLDVT